ncbi:MAG: metal ABC transporter ATP-binding protein [Eubacterium sp.]|nr:metal ABC transporter ATP-binding protein [Eubacterium sp.]MBR1531397.1 metal ABC transporter ATP-binding protein [Eubacterium sp.]
MALLKCESLALGYDGRAVADDISFEVNEGDYLCIVGENGSGKSTLVKTLLGLQKQLSGEIIYGDGLRKNEIGYLPQQTVVQKDFPASVGEIVMSGCIGKNGLKPFYTKADKQQALDTMEKMDILELKKRCYRELSGGQQQRVLLARALCATQRILLLDEPVSGLDPVVTNEMYALIEELNKQGTTIIMISHDISAALKYATHILHISDDCFFGTASQYVKSEKGKSFMNVEGGEGLGANN